MKGKMTTIKTNGVIMVLEKDVAITLDDLQTAVGGYVESIPMFDLYKGEHCVAFCNEEGKLKGLPLNAVATGYWWEQRHPHPPNDMLVGDIVIITGDNEMMEAL